MKASVPQGFASDQLFVDGTPVVQACMERNLLVNCTQGVVIRLLPAMNLSVEQAEEGLAILAGSAINTAKLNERINELAIAGERERIARRRPEPGVAARPVTAITLRPEKRGSFS